MEIKENKTVIIADLMTYIIEELQRNECKRHHLEGVESGVESKTPNKSTINQISDSQGIPERIHKIKERRKTYLEAAHFHSSRLQDLQALLVNVARSSKSLEEEVMKSILSQKFSVTMLNKIKDQYLRSLLSLYLKEHLLFVNYCTKRKIARHDIYVLM